MGKSLRGKQQHKNYSVYNKKFMKMLDLQKLYIVLSDIILSYANEASYPSPLQIWVLILQYTLLDIPMRFFLIVKGKLHFVDNSLIIIA